MRSWTTVKQILTMTCDEATRLVSESLDRELPRAERAAVRLHLLCCRACRRFRRQICSVREVVRHLKADSSDSIPGLSPEARTRIAQNLAHKLGKEST